jgi:hypothetical protein
MYGVSLVLDSVGAPVVLTPIFITMLLLDTYKYLVAPPVLHITAHTCALHRPARMEGLVAGLACQLSCKFAFALQKFPRKA